MSECLDSFSVQVPFECPSAQVAFESPCSEKYTEKLRAVNEVSEVTAL